MAHAKRRWLRVRLLDCFAFARNDGTATSPLAPVQCVLDERQCFRRLIERRAQALQNIIADQRFDGAAEFGCLNAEVRIVERPAISGTQGVQQGSGDTGRGGGDPRQIGLGLNERDDVATARFADERGELRRIFFAAADLRDDAGETIAHERLVDGACRDRAGDVATSHGLLVFVACQARP